MLDTRNIIFPAHYFFWIFTSDFMEYRQETRRGFAIPATGCQTKAVVEMLLGRRFSISAVNMDKLDTLQAYFFPLWK